MLQEQLISICKKFTITDNIERLQPISSGHINDTFLAFSDNDKRYVLQKLNTAVFKNYSQVIQNKVIVSNHLSKYYSQNKASNYCSIQFIKTNEGSYYYQINNGIWMLMPFINNSQVFEKATNSNLVYEAGKLYGNFINVTKTVDKSKISETLPEFHSVPWRLKQFDNALKSATKERITVSRPWIELISKYRLPMSKLWKLKEDQVLPIRITHNDTKLSNILFSQTQPPKGLAVIDLDTVMPGLVAFDFGDSVRSICSSTTEDDANPDNVYLNLNYYDAFCKGFASETKDLLTKLEIKYLPLGVQTLIFIMGLRFLTDFLKHDTYYKIQYETHNFVRARNQFTLFTNLIENLDQVNTITQNNFGS